VLAAVQPLVVRAIDEDGDLDAYKGPDLDSDLYVADYGGDGTVDAVLDYADLDGDNDVDEMAFYFYMKQHAYFGKDVLRVWWGRDDGDDNLLWYDINYNYTQPLCQYRCHFSGEESFVAFGLVPAASSGSALLRTRSCFTTRTTTTAAKWCCGSWAGQPGAGDPLQLRCRRRRVRAAHARL